MLSLFITLFIFPLINVLIIIDKDKDFTPYRDLVR